MPRALAARLLRRPAPRLAVHRLEDRITPALFVAQPVQTFGLTALQNNGAVATGDFNGDGKLDAVVTNYGLTAPGSTIPLPGQKLSILLGLGSGQFSTSVSQLTVGSNQHVSFVTVADVNADGKLDLLCTSTTSSTEAGMLTVFLGNGTGGFTKSLQVATGGSNTAWVGVGQFTKGDTNLDAVVCSFGKSDDNGNNLSGNNFTFFQGDGKGGFTGTVIGNGLAFIPTAGAVADFDGDGNQDVVFTVPGVPADSTADQPDGFLQFFSGNGAGGFTAGDSPASGGPLPISVQAADLNADGKPDLVVANVGNPDSNSGYANFGKGTSVGVLLNTGGGTFGTVSQLTVGLNSGGSTGAFAVQVADFNLDGSADIAAITYGHPTNATNARVPVFLGDGKGGFAADIGSPFNTAATDGQYLAVADFDGNGTPDLVTVGANNQVVILLNQSVAPAATATALVSSANPAGFGTAVTFTATVTSGAGTPTVGGVTFFDGGVSIGGPVTLDAQGKATFTTSGLSVATHTITAKYGGGTGFAASTSNAVSQSITAAGTLTALQATPTTVAAGSPVTFTATVSSASGTPAGTVTFFDGAAQLGSPVALQAGAGGQQAVLVTSTLTAGSHLVTAVYAGNSNFTGSTSNTVQVTVGNPTPPPVDATVAVGSSANPSGFGTAVTFTATVTAPSGTPAGTVTFFDGPTAVSGAITIAGSPAKATFSTAALSVGPHAITAKYSGAAGFNPAEGSLGQVVNPILTGVSVASDLNPATVTLPVTFTAAVTAASGTPAGAVQFFDGLVAVSGLVPVGAGNTATFTTSGLSVASHEVTAKFVPATGDFAASTSPAFVQLVNKAGVTVTVSSGGPAVVTQPVTLTATLVKVPAIAPDPTGLVTFKLNGVTLGSAPAAGGMAVYSTAALPVGGGTVTAEYAGDVNFSAGTSPGFAQAVNKAGVTVTLQAGGPATVGVPVTFLAVVAESPNIAPDPTGLVAFKLNGATIGTVAVGNGSASFTTAALPVGAGTVTAEYAGDASFAAGASAPLTQQILPVGTSVAVGTSSTPITVSLGVTLTATVVAAVGTPAGSVQFFTGGTAVSGLVPVAGGKASFSTTALPVGTTAVTAQFVPADGTFAGSTSAALSQVVVKADPGVTVAVEAAAAGQPSAIRAAVLKPNGVAVEPGGTVTFRVNGTTVGTAPVVGGLATLSTVLPAGTSSVTAEFGGDGNFGTAAATATATSGGGSGGQNPGLVGYREFGVGAGAGRAGDARFFNPDGTERFTAGGLFGGTGGVRVTSADFNGDGVADLVAGTGPGGASRVVVLDGKTRAVLFSVDPFEATFTGGVYVTAGDVTGDGVPDLVISPDEGGGPRVRVFSGAGFGQVADFFGIDDPNFRGGARAAVADLNGDGTGDLVVAAGFGGGPRVAVYSGRGLGSEGGPKLYADFFVFEESLRNGAFVAAGDVDGDGVADLISGGGPGGGPRVTILSGADLLAGRERVIANFFAGDPNNRGGVRLAARDLDGDNKADLVVGAGTGAGNRVTGYSGKSLATNAPAEVFAFDAFPGFDGGVYVG